jgi:hypothetical protein
MMKTIALVLAAATAACVPIPGTGATVQPSAREYAGLAVLRHLAALRPEAAAYVVSEKGQAPTAFVMDQLRLGSGSFVTAPDYKVNPGTRHPVVRLDLWGFDFSSSAQVVVEAGYTLESGEPTTCRFNLVHAGADATYRVQPNPIPACSR